VLFALPVLGLMLVLSTGLQWGLLGCPLLLLVQFVLLAGIAWLVAAVSVFLRDVPNLIAVALMVLFYLTPVFYSRSIVPERFRWVLDLNPLATIIEAYRALLLREPAPDVASLIVVGVLSLGFAVVGYRVFVRLAPRFADQL
jgi:lipopolysaccharide transport system permease protein